MENKKSIDEMSTEDLKALVASREQADRKQREKERKTYEEDRDDKVLEMIIESAKISHQLQAFKNELHLAFDEHQMKLQEYGGIRSNSKGGFSLVHSSGNFKAVRTRSTFPSWDERSTKAIELISDFMQDTVKKKDLKLFEILKSFIEKNDKGELEYAKVMHLFKHKDKYEDPRWVEGLNLIQESYSITLKGYGYDFFVKNRQQKWQKIEINFTQI